jgi:prepilin-type N-terminal cleavage/methylation domain-containing protein
MKKKGFTLIELLVVISIIALLLAVLLPALRTAKNQARVTLCAANIKQIDLARLAYEASNNDKVPVLFSNYAYTTLAPIENVFPSIALRDYIEMRTPIGTGATAGLDVKGYWYLDDIKNYAINCMPEFFVCPFNRERKREGDWVKDGPMDIGGFTFELWRTTGYVESYGAWTYHTDALEAALAMSSVEHPYGPEHGKPKYKNLNWYNSSYFVANALAPLPYRPQDTNNQVKNISLSSEFKSVSQKTLLSCNQGEWIPDFMGASPTRIYNYKSHIRRGRGGSNAVFGDSHVEWIPGSQHGWK